MKLIFIMADTFRRDHLGAYGNKWIHTPNLDRLAATSNVFDSMYVGSFPTLPNRRDIYLGIGQEGKRFNQWKGIENKEITIAERLAEKKIPTMQITDVANSVTNGKNFFKGFECYCSNRGQEGDNTWLDDSVPLEWPVEPHLIRYTSDRWHQVLVNRAHRRVEDDWFAPSTYKLACEWLERNRKREDFLLWIETFDPHEPWDPPQWYIDLYDPGYKGRVFEAPTYGFYKEMGMTDREVRHIHARYAGECTMVDNCIGRLMKTLEKVGLDDEVAIVFTSDHGAYFGLEGDAGAICKPNNVGADGMLMSAGRPMTKPVRHFPLRTGTMRIPLLIHLPGQKRGQRIARITQPWDLTPTILALFGMKSPKEFFGESLLPVIGGKRMKQRACAFNGAGGALWQAINHNWIYSVWREGLREPSLIDLRGNPAQDRNAARKNPEICHRMQAAISSFDPDAPKG